MLVIMKRERCLNVILHRSSKFIMEGIFGKKKKARSDAAEEDCRFKIFFLSALFIGHRSLIKAIFVTIIPA